MTDAHHHMPDTIGPEVRCGHVFSSIAHSIQAFTALSSVLSTISTLCYLHALPRVEMSLVHDPVFHAEPSAPLSSHPMGIFLKYSPLGTDKGPGCVHTIFATYRI